MEKYYKKEGKYGYYEAGEGIPIVILHGLMGDLAILTLWLVTFLTKGTESSSPIYLFTLKTY